MFIKPEVKNSSFLSVEKDINLIVNKMMANETLKRLLFHTTKDALKKNNLTEDESLSLLGKNIKRVPKLQVDGEVLNYIIVNFDNFVPSGNPQFRDNFIEFDIICHFDQWELDNLQLRPYKIAGEIDSMFNGKKLTGIGITNFIGANQIILNSEFAGFCLMYEAVHGAEDEIMEASSQLQDIKDKDAKAYLDNLLG